MRGGLRGYVEGGRLCDNRGEGEEGVMIRFMSRKNGG